MLSLLIWIPIAAAGAIALVPSQFSAKQVRSMAAIASTISFVLSLWLIAQFDLTNPGFQFEENMPWLEWLGLNYQLGADGLSISLLVLNGLLTLIAIFSSSATLERPRMFYSLVLLASGGIAGAFLAQNLLLFFLFYELELIPFYLLISIWGGAKRSYAATKFLIYTAVSGALVLVAFLGLVWLSGASTFGYEALLGQALPMSLQLVLLGLLLVGFGIKIPLVPFHTWLPDTYVEASAPVTILLGGLLAKLGAYGIFRFGLGLFPDAWGKLAPWLAIWAAISIMYGALGAIAQKDIKRMVAYSSIGHMGYILLGGAALTPLAMVGAVSQMVAHGLILAILFNLVGLIEEKVGTRDLDVLNGLMNPVRGLPAVSSLLVVGAMASAGIPGLAGFVAEFLIFQGSYAVFPVQTLLAVVGTGLTAVYFVILLNRTCFGKLDNKTAYYPNVSVAEKAPALVLAGIVLFLGLQPTWLVRWSESTTKVMVAAVPSMETTADIVPASAPALKPFVMPEPAIAQLNTPTQP
ncbi:NADH-quinone oxidoreductase subunit M [Leptolyngbya sp. AN02str]|uniref:NADH-quinone oxidoreductase subunit M n=1 Tax=Leptolyngbya sp. AN02str TaxID=3423363 RepID=UPI003D310278